MANVHVSSRLFSISDNAISLESTVKENLIRRMTSFLRKFIKRHMHEKYIDQHRKRKVKHWFFYTIRLDFEKDLLPPRVFEHSLLRVESDVSSGLTASKHS